MKWTRRRRPTLRQRPTPPDFVIIGAQKAGSTALMRHLSGHPEVYMARGETRYFRDPWFDMETPDVLEAAVADADAGVRRRGIKSPDLLGLPQSPERIRDTLGIVDLIAVLRDPVARAVSAYHWAMQFGWLPIGTAEEGLRRLLDGHDGADNARAAEVLEFGRYGAHLTRFLEVFPRDRLCVILQDDLRSDLARQSVALFRFLGVDSQRELPRAGGAVNESVYSPTRLRFIQHRNRYVVRPYEGYEGTYVQYATGARGRLVAGGVTALDRLLLTRICDNTKPEISRQLQARLVDFYRDDIATTSRIIGRDLSAWTRPAGSLAS